MSPLCTIGWYHRTRPHKWRDRACGYVLPRGDTDLAQASAIRPELADVKPTPISEQAGAALDRAGVAKPQGVGEQLYSGAVSALPGAALGGAAGALTRLGTGAASGAASTGAGMLAHAAGASPAQQAAIELAAGLAVPGGAAAGSKLADARALARFLSQGRQSQLLCCQVLMHTTHPPLMRDRGQTQPPAM